MAANLHDEKDTHMSFFGIQASRRMLSFRHQQNPITEAYMRSRSLLVVAALLSSCLAAHASLIGDSVHVRYLNPNTSTAPFDFGTQTVVNGLTDTAYGNVSLSFGANQITITNLTAGGFTSNSFNGFDVALLTGSPFSAVTYNAATAALFSGSALTFSANDIRLNLAGTCNSCKGGEKIVLDVVSATAVTPEPSSLALLGTGILGIVGVARRRLA